MKRKGEGRRMKEEEEEEERKEGKRARTIDRKDEGWKTTKE